VKRIKVNIYKMPKLDLTKLQIRQGDCLEHLKSIDDESVDLVFTSPPYADRRSSGYSGDEKFKYDGVQPDQYVDWFLPIAKEVHRILKPTGSFFLNIKAACDKGERLLYVYDLVLSIKREAGLRFVDEYIWYKSASPRKKSFRLKDCWEPIFHFSKQKNFINHDLIRIKSESTFGDKRGYSCYNDVTGNIGGYHDVCTQVSGWTDPDNILYFPTSLMVKDGKMGHPAKFPVELADFIVKGFCPPNGTVLDPFCGSGTTLLAATRLGCEAIGFDLEQKYVDLSHERLKKNFPPAEKPRKDLSHPQQVYLFEEDDEKVR